MACSEAGFVGSPYAHPIAPAYHSLGYAHHGAYPYSHHYGAYPYSHNYGAYPYSHHYPYAAYPFVDKTQYHTQDIFGQASYGYAHPGQAHAAVRDAAGHVKGSYAYINPEGKEIRVNYKADAQGFHAESNALPEAPVANLVAPEPVQDTPEVVEARKAHLDAVAEVKSRQKRGVLAYAPVTYTYAHPVAYTVPVVRSAVLTQIVHNPGHAVSYRID